MSADVYERCRRLGAYMLEKKTTIRQAAKAFGYSKSTVHKDLSERLKIADPVLAKQVSVLLSVNKDQRHIRGGESTKRKYANKK